VCRFRILTRQLTRATPLVTSVVLLIGLVLEVLLQLSTTRPRFREAGFEKKTKKHVYDKTPGTKLV
jgi:hypothetical protein